MEFYDHLMKFLLENMSVKDDEFDKTYKSIITAVKDKQYVIMNDDNNSFTGFLTWEIQDSIEEYGKIDLGITNLVIHRKARGAYPLHRVTTFLRRQYPNIGKFIWINRKRKRKFEAKQKDNLCLSTL